MKALHLLFIDFNDSFSFNIIQCLKNLGHRVDILNHDRVDDYDLSLFSSYDIVVLGPGPGHIDDYPIFKKLLSYLLFKEEVLFLGICLGHQFLGDQFGLQLQRLDSPLHGRSLSIDKSCDYLGIKKHDIKAMFYNSWTLKDISPSENHFNIRVIWENEMVTIVETPLSLGLQFHPESVGTSCPILILDYALSIVYNKSDERPNESNWALRPANYSTS